MSKGHSLPHDMDTAPIEKLHKAPCPVYHPVCVAPGAGVRHGMCRSALACVLMQGPSMPRSAIFSSTTRVWVPPREVASRTFSSAACVPLRLTAPRMAPRVSRQRQQAARPPPCL